MRVFTKDRLTNLWDLVGKVYMRKFARVHVCRMCVRAYVRVCMYAWLLVVIAVYV